MLEVADEFGYRLLPRPNRGDLVWLRFYAYRLPYPYQGEEGLMVRCARAVASDPYTSPWDVVFVNGRAVALDVTDLKPPQALALARRFPEARTIVCYECQDTAVVLEAARPLRSHWVWLVLDHARLSTRKLVRLFRALQGRIAFLSLSHGRDVNEAFPTLLRTQPRLRHLVLVDTYVSPRHLAGILKLRELETLSLGNRLDEPDLRAMKLPQTLLSSLGQLAHLRVLRLQNAELSDRLCSSLSFPPKLQALELPQNPISDPGLSALAAKLRGRPLHRLDLSQTKVTDAGLAQLSGFADLEDLRVSETAVTDRGLKALGRVKGLRWLDVGKTRVSGSNLEPLTRLFGLRLSDLKFFQPKGLGSLTRLEILDLSGTQLPRGSLQQVGGLSRLRSLNLGHTSIQPWQLRHLLGLQQLRFLGLSNIPVGDAVAARLAGLKSLRGLDLSKTKITDRTLGPLATLPYLLSLNLQGTHVTNAGLRALASGRQLHDLDLVGANISAQGIWILGSAKRLSFLWVDDDGNVPSSFFEAHPRLVLEALP